MDVEIIRTKGYGSQGLFLLGIQFGHFTDTLKEDFGDGVPPFIEEGSGHLIGRRFLLDSRGFLRHCWCGVEALTRRSIL
jgi:hypothetical protein